MNKSNYHNKPREKNSNYRTLDDFKLKNGSHTDSIKSYSGYANSSAGYSSTRSFSNHKNYSKMSSHHHRSTWLKQSNKNDVMNNRSFQSNI